MRAIYSLKEFHQRAAEISGKRSDLISVTVEFGLYGKTRFTCYADGVGEHFAGQTMEESLQRLRDAVHPPKQPDIDIEIDVPVENPKAENNIYV
jgi:hypothetical protein